MNDMIVNPDKLQAMILSCDKKKENKYDLNINNPIIISSVDTVKLLGIEIDNKLNLKSMFQLLFHLYIFVKAM